MKSLRWLCLVLLMGAATMSFASDVQVVCEPGVQVFLDGKLVGTTSAKEDGLFLAKVPKGVHVVRVEKNGFVPQSFQVEVAKVPVEVKVAEFAPEPTPPYDSGAAAAPVKQSAGNLVVTSAPQNCVVEIDGKPQDKGVPLLLVESLAAGEHKISFSKPGYDRISGVVKVLPGVDVAVRGDLFEGTVEAVNEGKGSLRVVSTPDHVTVHFRGKVSETYISRLNVTFVPAGEYPIRVVWRGYELSSMVAIIKGHRTVLEVSFIKGARPFAVSYEPE